MTVPARLVWVVIDGVPFWLIDRLGRDPVRYPMLAALISRGDLAALAPVSPNCQTPPSLFTLFSGVPPAVHGLTGFDVPDTQVPAVALSAFEAYDRRHPMVWDRYGQASGAVRLCQIPFVQDDAGQKYTVPPTNGFGPPVLAPESLHVARHPVDLPAEGGRAELESDGLTLILRLDSGEAVTLPPGEWVSVHLGQGARSLVGNAPPPEGAPGRVLHILGSWADPAGGAGHGLGYAFVAGGIGKLYRDGRLGLIAADGGDGAAETCLWEAIRHIGRRFWAEALGAADDAQADLVLAYQPAYDLLFHEILGYLDHDSALAGPTAHRVCTAILEEALAEIDAGCAALAAAQHGRRVLVCSDHGMKPIDTVLLPNVLLAEWGLAATGPDAPQQLDPEGSVAFLHPAETGVVTMHTARLAKSGLSPAALMERLCDALEAASGQRPGWFRADVDRPVPEGWQADHYLQPGLRQMCKADLGPAPWRRSRKSADHSTWSPEDSLHGIVAAVTPHPQGALPPVLPAAEVAAVFAGTS